jgi:hypothetical protein
MLYVAPDGSILDDGYGMATAPAYAVDEHGARLELSPEDALGLTRQYQAQFRSRLPLGDAVARVTKAVGIQPCTPCEARQRAMNQFGDRLAGYLPWQRR